MKSQDIRKIFLTFFKNKKHLIVASAPIVLKEDPTLMFNNSGMAQFKEYFLGNARPKSNRIADTQKCLRVSGKHNDLEEVGIDTYHHTMFEMLGNWSFGDYFKKEAIHWAWELLTEVYKIDKNILYVTVFEGSKEDKVPFDQEAYDIWKTLVDEDHILLGNKKDNFWEMGEQGPCGPCSEIHVDIRSATEKSKIKGRDLVNKDHPQVIEIWNNVFMEFNRKADGSLEKLPEQHVDTGMGFERLCMVLQGVKSTYDTDIFTPLIQKIEKITGTHYSSKKSETQHQEQINIAIRVIADHVRAVAFAIADGQLPSNTGAGYVIRRILRRAIRYAFTFLDKKEPFIYELVSILSEQMGCFFPEITAQKDLVANVIKEEETSFLRALEQGLQLLEEVIVQTRETVVSGQKAFELYDTFGFPIDLTALILREKGLSLDMKGFDEEMLKQKTRSRAASEMMTDDWVVLGNEDTENFIGYDHLAATVKITRYRKVISKKDGTFYQLVLNKTPFYPEGGGQVGDQGVLSNNSETIVIFDTKKENNLILHFTKKLPTKIHETVVVSVDYRLRKQCAGNHSATHLLHQALRTILGTHVEQKGSLVSSKSLRFDFSHFAKMTENELLQVENFVNQKIKEQLPLVEKRNIPFDQAVQEGAMALFGEKYGDTVRAIQFGKSIELCGGIHVKNTADIWHFKITGEGAVAAGIRRIEAITNDAVQDYFIAQEHIIKEIKETLKSPQDAIKAIVSLQDENVKLKKQVTVLMTEKTKHLKTGLISEIKEKNGVRYLAKQVDLDATRTKELVYDLGDIGQNLFLVLATEEDDKPMLTCYISKELVAEKGLHAGQIVRELGRYIQGGGGGQAFFATAGGKNKQGIQEALEKVITFIP